MHCNGNGISTHLGSFRRPPGRPTLPGRQLSHIAGAKARPRANSANEVQRQAPETREFPPPAPACARPGALHHGRPANMVNDVVNLCVDSGFPLLAACLASSAQVLPRNCHATVILVDRRDERGALSAREASRFGRWGTGGQECRQPGVAKMPARRSDKRE